MMEKGYNCVTDCLVCVIDMTIATLYLW